MGTSISLADQSLGVPVSEDVIFLRREASGPLTVLSASRYEAEAMLQELLEQYPELLSGSDMRPDSPRRFILVRREVPVPDHPDGAGRWSVDHLFLDQDAVPTLVEVKRSTNTEIRRQVVGQMLDYAANGVRYWGEGRLRDMFEHTWRTVLRPPRDDDASGPATPDEAIAALLGNDASAPSADEYWQRADANLRTGRIRLVFVADSIPEELRAIIEFLNEKMTDVEVFGVEVRQYTNRESGSACYVPRLIGATAIAIQNRRSTSTITLAEFLESCDEAERGDIGRVLDGWAGLETAKVTATNSNARLFLFNPLKPGDTCVLTISPRGEVWLSRGYILVAQRADDLAARTAELGEDLTRELDNIIHRSFPQAAAGAKNYYLKVPKLDADAIVHFGSALQGWFALAEKSTAPPDTQEEI